MSFSEQCVFTWFNIYYVCGHIQMIYTCILYIQYIHTLCIFINVATNK